MTRSIRTLFAALAVCLGLSVLCASDVEARYDGKNLNLYQPGKLSAVALNGAAGTRTFTVDTDGWSVVTFWVDYTHANNGTLTLTCTGGPRSADRDYTLTTCTVASGTCTINFGGVMVTSSLTGDKKYGVQMGVQAVDDISCVIAHGGAPNANDVVSIDVELEAN